MKDNTTDRWVPEICYEEDGEGLSSHIPFIPVPQSEEMPKVLFIFQSKETGEFEPGTEGEEVPVIELDLHQYVDMNTLRDTLPIAVYDMVRQAVGLEPLSTAVEKGRAITDRVRKAVE